MIDYLILKLDGPMQAWGVHSFENKRPSASFPTFSGIIGLLAACLGIRRVETARLQQLSRYLKMAVRIDSRRVKISADTYRKCPSCKYMDFHTVKNAREDYNSLKSHETIITRREYLYDSQFTIALWKTAASGTNLEEIRMALNKPVFNPFLGRRSCPITRPLFEKIIQAADEFKALAMIAPQEGVIYSETPGGGQSLN